MSNTFKIGDKLLLRVSFNGYLGSSACVVSDGYRTMLTNPLDAETLIPATTLTDLQAENARLRVALGNILDLLEQPNHRDVTPQVVYLIALKALGDEE